MEKFGGSELVALELAEELQARGHDVIIYTHLLADPIRSEIKLPVVTQRPDLSSFDVIWSHHNMTHGHTPRPSQRMIFNHMSSYVDLEFPQDARWEESVADRIFANSPETQKRMMELGLTSCEIYPNPAPASYQLTEDGRYGLFVSNHRPLTLKLLAPTLGCPNKFIGEADRFQRVTPELIAGAHFIVTNGKTVQYALRAGKPVFLFDHMGGPGWLNSENIEKAAWHNFSGRCTRDSLNVSTLREWRGRDHITCPDVMKLEWWLDEMDL
jgi:hypothetical protein